MKTAAAKIILGRANGGMNFVLTLALTLNPLPQERKSPLADSGFADDCPANPVAGFSKRRRTILLLLGEKAGLRESVTSNYSRAGNCLPLDCPDGTNKSGVWPSPATAMHERRRTLAKSMPACFAALLRPGTHSDGRGNTAVAKISLGERLAIRLAKNEFCRILKTMSAQETLIEEIKRQPEPVVREVLHYLKFLERQRAQEDWADVLPSREVEQEKLDILDGK
jgi:hypothetical protein